jgi:hypothetical protein
MNIQYFIRQRETVGGDTPASLTNINIDIGEKKWENLLSQSIKRTKRG